AGVVVFVNNVEDYRASVDATQAKLQAEQQLRVSAVAKAANERDEQSRLHLAAQQQLAARDATIAQLQKQIVDKNVELATANKNLSTQQVSLTAATEATRAAQEQATRLTTEQSELRQTVNE